MSKTEVIIIAVVALSALFSCSEKEGIDYRDAWTGEYVGTLHSISWSLAGDTTYTQDTTINCHVAVVKSSHKNDIMYVIPMRYGSVFSFRCNKNGIISPYEEAFGQNLSGSFFYDSLRIKRSHSSQGATGEGDYRLKKYEYQSWEY